MPQSHPNILLKERRKRVRWSEETKRGETMRGYEKRWGEFFAYQKNNKVMNPIETQHRCVLNNNNSIVLLAKTLVFGLAMIPSLITLAA